MTETKQQAIARITAEATRAYIKLHGSRITIEYPSWHMGIRIIVALHISPRWLFEHSHTVTWTAYIMLRPGNFGEGYFDNNLWLEPRDDFRGYSGYMDILDNVRFHGGITFYEKYKSASSPHRCIKVGCDYSHLGDPENKPGDTYAYPFVLDSIRRVIDELHAHYQIKVWCGIDGKYYLPEEGAYRNGEFFLAESEKNTS